MECTIDREFEHSTFNFEYFWRQGTIEYTIFLVFLWHVGLPINKLKSQTIIVNTATTTCTSWTDLVRSEQLVNTLPVQPRFPHYSRLSSAARSDVIWSMICQRGELKGKQYLVDIPFKGKCWASKCSLWALLAFSYYQRLVSPVPGIWFQNTNLRPKFCSDKHKIF